MSFVVIVHAGVGAEPEAALPQCHQVVLDLYQPATV